MPTPLQNPNVVQRLARWSGLFGRTRFDLADEIIPTVLTADHSVMSAPPVRRFAALQANQAAGGAGELATFSFEVPPSLLAWIRRITLVGETDQRFLLQPGGNVNTAGFTLVEGSFFDMRLVQNGELPGAVLLRGTQAGALGSVTMTRQFSATVPPPQATDILVGSGNRTDFAFLEIQATVANEIVRICLEWDEYQLLPTGA